MAEADRDALRNEYLASAGPDFQNPPKLSAAEYDPNSDPDSVKRSVEDPITGRRRSGESGPGLVPGTDIAVALSGGGVRAALFGLGVLMATYDANMVPLRLSSVSGGSITNMMLADQYFSKMAATRPADHDAWKRASHDAWERATLNTFRAICRGSLTRTWLTTLAAFILGLPIISLILYMTQNLPSPLVLGPIFAAWLTALFFRGHLIEALMARRYLGKGWRRRNLADLLPRDKGDDEYLWQEHVFCCTDLLIGRPVHFKATSGHESRSSVFRRTSDPRGGESPLTIRPWPNPEQFRRSHGTLYDNPKAVPLSGILRATAGFPGIPPRLFMWKRYLEVPTKQQSTAQDPIEPAELQPGSPEVSDTAVPTELLPDQGFLSDGGIWNNLATEPFEDRFIFDNHGPWDVVVSDASGPLRRSHRLMLSIPGLAELTALIREESILANNTIGPRRQVYMHNVLAELRQPALREHPDRIYLVVSCGETPEQLVDRLKNDFLPPDGEWHNESGLGYAEERHHSVESHLKNVTEENTREHATLASFQRWSVLQPRRNVADPVAQYATTLAAVPTESALAIVARGYCNAALTLYLCNLSEKLHSPKKKGWLQRELSVAKPASPGRDRPMARSASDL